MLFIHDIHASEEECYRTFCNQTVGSLEVGYYSIVKIDDQKINEAHFTPDQTFSVSGTREERLRACTEKCMKDDRTVCKSGNLSPHQENSPSTCELLLKNPYSIAFDLIPVFRKSATGWTSFHLRVGLLLTFPNYVSFLHMILSELMPSSQFLKILEDNRGPSDYFKTP